jgi:hypothetical protein
MFDWFPRGMLSCKEELNICVISPVFVRMFFSEFGLSKTGIVACLKGKRHSDKFWGLLWLAQSSCVLLHMALQLQVKALSTRHEAQIRMLSQCTSHMSMSFSAFGST